MVLPITTNSARLAAIICLSLVTASCGPGSDQGQLGEVASDTALDITDYDGVDAAHDATDSTVGDSAEIVALDSTADSSPLTSDTNEDVGDAAADSHDLADSANETCFFDSYLSKRLIPATGFADSGTVGTWSAFFGDGFAAGRALNGDDEPEETCFEVTWSLLECSSGAALIEVEEPCAPPTFDPRTYLLEVVVDSQTEPETLTFNGVRFKDGGPALPSMVSSLCPEFWCLFTPLGIPKSN